MATRPSPTSRYDQYDGPDALNEHMRNPGDPDGVVAEELRRRQSQGHPEPPHSPEVHYRIKKHHLRKPNIHWNGILGALLILAALGAAYWMGFQRASNPPKSLISKPKIQHGRTAGAVAAPMTHYDSSIYAIGISYPDNWIISDTPAKLTITSPNYNMTTVGGKTVGHIIITLQNQQKTVPGFPAGGATASLESTKLTYTNPTANVQRAQTYVSYLDFGGINGIDAIYLTGNYGYKKGQVVPMSDVAKGDPLISVTFATCSVSYCTKGTPTPITLQTQSWATATFKSTIMNILQSLTVQ